MSYCYDCANEGKSTCMECFSDVKSWERPAPPVVHHHQPPNDAPRQMTPEEIEKSKEFVRGCLQYEEKNLRDEINRKLHISADSHAELLRRLSPYTVKSISNDHTLRLTFQAWYYFLQPITVSFLFCIAFSTGAELINFNPAYPCLTVLALLGPYLLWSSWCYYRVPLFEKADRYTKVCRQLEELQT